MRVGDKREKVINDVLLLLSEAMLRLNDFPTCQKLDYELNEAKDALELAEEKLRELDTSSFAMEYKP